MALGVLPYVTLMVGWNVTLIYAEHAFWSIFREYIIRGDFGGNPLGGGRGGNVEESRQALDERAVHLESRKCHAPLDYK